MISPDKSPRSTDPHNGETAAWMPLPATETARAGFAKAVFDKMTPAERLFFQLEHAATAPGDLPAQQRSAQAHLVANGISGAVHLTDQIAAYLAEPSRLPEIA